MESTFRVLLHQDAEVCSISGHGQKPDTLVAEVATIDSRRIEFTRIVDGTRIVDCHP